MTALCIRHDKKLRFMPLWLFIFMLFAIGASLVNVGLSNFDLPHIPDKTAALGLSGLGLAIYLGMACINRKRVLWRNIYLVCVVIMLVPLLFTLLRA